MAQRGPPICQERIVERFAADGGSAAFTRATQSRHTGPRVGTTMQSDSALPCLHSRQMEIAPLERGRSPGPAASCATMPLQTSTHSSQMNADAPAMRCRRTPFCEVWQNEQRYRRVLKKNKNENSRFSHMTRSRLRPDACRAACSDLHQGVMIPLAPPPWRSAAIT